MPKVAATRDDRAEEPLTVLLLSCGRLDYLTRTLAAVRRHFVEVEPDVKPVWVCFDNGSPPEEGRRLGELGFDLLMLSRGNLGVGPAMNRLVAAVRTPFLLNLQDDWLLENPERVPFVRESLRILRADARLAQVKLDVHHFTDFSDRKVYDGPFRADGGSVEYHVQNPEMLWGGFTFPPAVARTEALHRTGPFTEEQPFRRGWAESEFSARFSRSYHVVKSPGMLLFRHIGEEHSPGWGEAPGATTEEARGPGPE